MKESFGECGLAAVAVATTAMAHGAVSEDGDEAEEEKEDVVEVVKNVKVVQWDANPYCT